jgi:hypothetical protein
MCEGDELSCPVFTISDRESKGPRLIYFLLEWQEGWGPLTFPQRYTKIPKVIDWSTDKEAMVAMIKLCGIRIKHTCLLFHLVGDDLVLQFSWLHIRNNCSGILNYSPVQLVRKKKKGTHN